jgi:uracil DNA glycosylase
LKARLPQEWETFLNADGFNLSAFYRLLDPFLKNCDIVIPAIQNIFAVFNYIKPADVRCVLFGEDPYPRITSACGVAFWDKEITDWSDKTNGNSLKNILKALLVARGKADYNTPISACRTIASKINFKSPPRLFEHWLNQGILLINSAMTFSGSTDKKNHFMFWKPFHLNLIRALNKKTESPFYILWGNKAQGWEKHIIESIDQVDKIIKQGHPTFIHQFLDKNNPVYSPFTEIIAKTKLSWV